MTVRALLSRAFDLVVRGRRETRLADEIQAHLDQLTDEYVARGMTPADARRAARRAFGGVEQVKSAYRDQRGLPFADALAQDIRFACRLLWRDRAFSIAAVLVLGVGIGVNNMLFTIVNAHTIRGLPLDRVDRVVYVSTFDDRTPDRGVSYADFEDLRDGARDVVSLAVFSSAPAVIGGDGIAADRLEGAAISRNTFGVLGIQPALGRDFTAEDDRPGAAAVAILGGGTWASRYGSSREILGRSILVNGTPTVIVGVMAERSGFPGTAEVWLPLAATPGLTSQPRDARTLRVVGRLRDGVAIEEARSAIESIADRLAHDRPDTNENVRARVVPINERFLGRVTDPAWFAFMSVGCLVVLISAANAANLVLASSVKRTREIAIRSSLGASRQRVMRQLLTEGVFLAFAGGLAGLALAMGGVRVFRTAIPENVLPYWFDYSLDWRVFVALVAVSLATVLLFALLPAIPASKADVSGILKDGGPVGRGGRGTERWTTAFLAAEFGLAVVMLAHTTTSVRSSSAELPSDAAIDSTKIMTAVLTLARDAYPSPEQRIDFYQRLSERLRANPAVSEVTVASAAPLQGAPEEQIEIAGRPAPSGTALTVRTVLVAPRYFETFDLTLIRGRGLSADDGAPGQEFAIVNERLVREFFEGQDPIGQRLSLLAPGAAAAERRWFTIAGVAPDIRQRAVSDPEAIVYLPFRTAPAASATLLVRARGEGEDLVPLLRQEVMALDANLPLYRIRTLAQAIRDARWNPRLAARLVLVLTLIAVGLSTAGLYAVTAYGVSQRTHEIGLRMALGARTMQVARLILRRVAAQLAMGFAAGVLLAMLWDRNISSGPGRLVSDPTSLLLVAAILVGVAAIASWLPIRRAARLEPISALRRAP